jgi:hypothetical protein
MRQLEIVADALLLVMFLLVLAFVMLAVLW